MACGKDLPVLLISVWHYGEIVVSQHVCWGIFDIPPGMVAVIYEVPQNSYRLFRISNFSGELSPFFAIAGELDEEWRGVRSLRMPLVK